MSTLAIPSVPSGSIIAVIIILSAVSISPENIGIIISLEWITYVYLLHVDFILFRLLCQYQMAFFVRESYIGAHVSLNLLNELRKPQPLGLQTSNLPLSHCNSMIGVYSMQY